MSRSLEFHFSSLSGISYDSGDVRFSPNSHSLLSPVGHRLNRFGLTGGGVDSSSETFGFETPSPIHRVAVSKAFLAVVDGDNRGFLCNMDTGVVVHRFHVNAGTDVSAVCRNLEFSRDGLYLAISIGRKVQVWRLPETRCKVFSPMVLEHEFAIHAKDVVSLDWAPSDFGFLTGSQDTTAHLQLFQRERRTDTAAWDYPAHELSVSLVGHKTAVVGCFYLDRALEDPCIFTVSEDGSLFEWRYCAKTLDEGEDEGSIRKQRAKRRKHGTNSAQADKEWTLQQRHFVQRSEVATVTCVASNNQSFILFGFSNGVFALHELPTGQKLQSLSVSKFALESAAITQDGAWLALASPTLGQLVVWEWMSETFVLKQQGHFFNMNSLAHSPDGRSVATGADDGKVKLWSASTNTCFVTFTEHTGPISALQFASNSAVLSSSLDGTVRAFDLIRLRNFRTMTPPEPCQLTSLAISGGEVVCAGSMEPPSIFMWSLRTGKLLEVLSGHTGPISSLDFSPTSAVLASCSWDGSIKLWEPFKDTSAPLLTLTSTESAAPLGQLCVSFRPDGKELCSVGLDGNIVLWDVETGGVKGTIECKRDLGLHQGRVASFFNSVCYSADGRVVFAGGKSSWVFAYDCERELLLKKYQLAHRVMQHDQGGVEDEDGDDARKRRFREGKALPGTTRGRDAGKRQLLDPEIQVSSIRFSPTGRSWSVSTNQGMLTFSLDANAAFDPVNVDEQCTPQSAREACRNGEFALGVNQSLFLGEERLVRELLACVPLESLQLVASSVPKSQLAKCMDFIARSLEASVAVEYNIRWALALFAALSEADAQKLRHVLLPAFRALQKAVSRQEQMLAKMCDENMYDLAFALKCKPVEPAALGGGAVWEDDNE